MNSSTFQATTGKLRVILPVILRITLSLALWTLCALSVTIVEAQTREHRVVQVIPVNRAKVEDLQRWVNAGHDAWCRNPQMVAAMTLRRIAPEFANYDYELASLTSGDGTVFPTKATYTFHSIDGHTSYRVTLRRYRWQSKTAASLNETIWIPVRSETITRDSLD